MWEPERYIGYALAFGLALLPLATASLIIVIIYLLLTGNMFPC